MMGLVLLVKAPQCTRSAMRAKTHAGGSFQAFPHCCFSAVVSRAEGRVLSLRPSYWLTICDVRTDSRSGHFGNAHRGGSNRNSCPNNCRRGCSCDGRRRSRSVLNMSGTSTSGGWPTRAPQPVPGSLGPQPRYQGASYCLRASSAALCELALGVLAPDRLLRCSGHALDEFALSVSARRRCNRCRRNRHDGECR